MHKIIFILLASLGLPHNFYAMEPAEPVAAKEEKITCAICQEEIKEDQVTRTFSCNLHPLHKGCYQTLYLTAKKENKKIVPCPTCRIPINFFHLGFTQEERHQVSQFLKDGSVPAQS